MMLALMVISVVPLYMAILWSYTDEVNHYEVRTAGESIRLYRNGVHHSQWNPKRPLSGSIWDLLALPVMHRAQGSIRTACILGFGAGAVASVLQAVASIEDLVGVELDAMHLSIADGFFNCAEGCELVAGDAVAWAQENKETKYDFVLDDLYSEENGIPVRCAPLDLEWFNCLASMVAPAGVLALNLVEPEKIPHLPPMKVGELKKRFPYRKIFSMKGYENRVVAFSDCPFDPDSFADNLKQTLQNYPACRGVKQRYQIKDL